MFEVGQKVWDVVRGEGKVVEVRIDAYSYPVIVEFSDERKEIYTKEGLKDELNKNPSLYTYPVEIIKKVTKPSINWEHVHENYVFLSQDEDGRAWLYMEEPMTGGSCWHSAGSVHARANSHVSYISGTCDWKDSLVTRPEGV